MRGRIINTIFILIILMLSTNCSTNKLEYQFDEYYINNMKELSLLIANNPDEFDSILVNNRLIRVIGINETSNIKTKQSNNLNTYINSLENNYIIRDMKLDGNNLFYTICNIENWIILCCGKNDNSLPKGLSNLNMFAYPQEFLVIVMKANYNGKDLYFSTEFCRDPIFKEWSLIKVYNFDRLDKDNFSGYNHGGLSYPKTFWEELYWKIDRLF